jgi:tellurium resistance protein TerZ
MGVDLARGETVGLGEPGREGPAVIRLGLGWQARRPGPLGRLFGASRHVDLDASAVLFADGTADEVVYFRNLSGGDGSVTHSGDSLTGSAGQEDDEAIVVDLARVPDRVDQIVFTVNSFGGRPFAKVRSAYCRLADEHTGRELARFTLAGAGPHTGQVMAKVRREGTGWRMTAIGAPANGRTFNDLLPAMRAHL